MIKSKPPRDEFYMKACENAAQHLSPMIEAYRASYSTLSSRERAIEEDRIWDAVPHKYRSVIGRDGEAAPWLHMALKIDKDEAGYRARLRTLAKERKEYDVSYAWEFMNNPECSGSRVSKAISEAFKTACKETDGEKNAGIDPDYRDRKRKQRFAEALLEELTKPSGKSPKTETSAPRKDRSRSGRKQPKAPPTPPPPQGKPLEDVIVGGDGVETRRMWEEFQDFFIEKAREFAKNRLKDIETDAAIEERLVSFKAEMHACFQDFCMGLQQARNRRLSREILDDRRDRIRWALEVLRVEVKKGWVKERLDKAAIKTSYKKLSARFHPDNNNGDDKFKARYQEVQDAYQLLKSSLNL